MNTPHITACPATPETLRFCQQLVSALEGLKGRLQERYEHAWPDRRDLIERAVTEAEGLAWQTSFPQLVFPDLAEARVAALVGEAEFTLAA